VVRNQTAHQLKSDGWSCAFRVMRFLEHFLNGSSMEEINAAPIPQEVLARKLSVYYQFLSQKLIKPPENCKMFFEHSLEGKSIIQLRNMMQGICDKGWAKKQKNKNFLNNQQQIECILIKLWLMEQQEPGAFVQFVQEMGKGKDSFTPNQRRFLARALDRMEWTREAIVQNFCSTYFKETKHPISPD